MKTVKLSCAHALFKYLIAQKIIIGEKAPLFPGAFGIYGHGNVACLGQAMEDLKMNFQILEVIITKHGFNRHWLFSCNET